MGETAARVCVCNPTNQSTVPSPLGCLGEANKQTAPVLVSEQVTESNTIHSERQILPSRSRRDAEIVLKQSQSDQTNEYINSKPQQRNTSVFGWVCLVYLCILCICRCIYIYLYRTPPQQNYGGVPFSSPVKEWVALKTGHVSQNRGPLY